MTPATAPVSQSKEILEGNSARAKAGRVQAAKEKAVLQAGSWTGRGGINPSLVCTQSLALTL